MRRQGIFALFLLSVAVLAVYALHSRALAQTTTAAPKPAVVAHTPPPPAHLVNLHGKTILARELAADPRFRACKGPINLTPAESKNSAKHVGGFACARIHLITLTVTKTGTKVKVDPQVLTGVQPGDCIEWKTLTGDATVANLETINFLDNAAEAAAAGKPSSQVSDHPVGPDLCTTPRSSCVVAIALAEGRYFYEAKLKHGGTSKKADPEVDVSCGAPCGSLEDL